MRKRLCSLAIGAVLALAGPLAAIPPVGAAPPHRDCPAGFEMEVGIGCTKQLPNGNKLVHHRHGAQTETHGGDHEARAAPNAGETTSAAPPPERPVACATSGSRSQAVYAYLQGSANRLDSVRPQIQAAVRAANALLAREAAETGVVADFRFACDADNQPRVTAVSTSAADYSSVVDAARSAGLTSSIEDYWIFADFTSPGRYSGVGTFYADETLSASNANYRNAGYGVTYSGYWSGTTPMHEHGHNMGAVNKSSPDSSGAGHCDGYGSQDVMCYNDGGPTWDETHACGAVSERHYDACHNDYFHTRPAPGSYLATKHNIGANTSWAAFDNPFLAFGSATADPTPTPTPTPSTVTFTGGIATVGAGQTHSFSAAGGTVASALRCSGGGRSGFLSSSAASLRQELVGPAGTVLGSLTVKCDGVTRRLSVTSAQRGVHVVRVTKTAGGTGTTSYTATVSFTA